MPIKNIQKRYLSILTVMIAALVTLSPFAIDSYLAAIPIMAKFFNVPTGTAELTITLYFLGFAFGNFFGGPISDAFGRRKIALFGITLYGVSAIAIPFCNRITLIIILRVTQAFGGGFATVTANLFIRDWFSGKQIAKLLTVISMMMMIAPLLAPVIGTFLINHSDWKAVFYFLSGFALLLFIMFFILIPESRDKTLITRKLTTNQFLEKYKMFFSDRQSVIILFSVGFSMAAMFVFLTKASFVYIEYFGLAIKFFPLVFGANVILNILLSLLNTILLKKYQPRDIMRIGMLIQLMAGIALLVVVILPQPPFLGVFLSIVLFMGSLGLIFGNGTAVILNINPKVSGSANATIGIVRFLLSFLIGSMVALFQSENLIPLGVALFCCALIANILNVVALRNN